MSRPTGRNHATVANDYVYCLSMCPGQRDATIGTQCQSLCHHRDAMSAMSDGQRDATTRLTFRARIPAHCMPIREHSIRVNVRSDGVRGLTGHSPKGAGARANRHRGERGEGLQRTYVGQHTACVEQGASEMHRSCTGGRISMLQNTPVVDTGHSRTAMQNAVDTWINGAGITYTGGSHPDLPRLRRRRQEKGQCDASCEHAHVCIQEVACMQT